MPGSDLQGMLDSAPVHRALGLRVARADDHGLILHAQPGPEHAGADDSEFLHGGVVATVLDTTATFALIAATGTDWSTVDLRVDFLRPAPAGPLEARGRAVQAGRRLGRATAELYAAGSHRLLASAAGTFVRADPEPGADT
ncbi:MAG TPA: PaaI family thioesterase [Streptosporangiaceae bacterium]|nr:PaaI family thioesterase [Streptosporangiaceae bacterium]